MIFIPGPKMGGVQMPPLCSLPVICGCLPIQTPLPDGGKYVKASTGCAPEA